MSRHGVTGLCVMSLLVLLTPCTCERERQENPLNVKLGFVLVKKWARTLGERLEDNFVEHLSYPQFLMEFGQKYTSAPNDGSAIKDEIIANIERLLNNKRKAVEKLVKYAERINKNYTFDKDLDIYYLNSKDLLSQSELNTINNDNHTNAKVVEMAIHVQSLNLTTDPSYSNIPVNHVSSTVHVPTNVYDRFPKILNGANWSKRLDKKFRENQNDFASMKWQYFCSIDGFFRVFPGLKWPRDNSDAGIDLYDCRNRPWYLQAATCPKNIVILLDGSGSMKGARKIIARSTVKTILHTLNEDDYFNILSFSNEVEYVDQCFNGTMMPANEMNKRRLQEIIDENLNTSMKANFEKAFEEAFDLLKAKEYHRRKQGRLCNKAILLITDGVPEHYEKVFRKWNWPDKDTRVFTFLIGREVSDVREVRWMACVNKGFYSHISTLADVQENVQNYINVLSRPMVLNRHENRIWTSVYLDHMTTLDRDQGLQLMTSFAMPVFDRKNETENDRNLLGVMGTDVPIAMLKERAHPCTIGVNSFAFIINQNGYVLLHPNFSPYRIDPETKDAVLNPYYQNVNLLEVVHPENRENEMKLQDLIEQMTGEDNHGSMEVHMLTHYDNMKRMTRRKYHVQHGKIKNTKFRMGIAFSSVSLNKLLLADMSALYVYRELRKIFKDDMIEVAPWPYCDGLDLTLTDHVWKDALLKAVKAYEEGKIQCPNIELLQNMVYVHRSAKDVLTRRILANRHEMKGNGVDLIFFGSCNGMTMYMTPNKTVSEFISNNTDPFSSEYYTRAVESVENTINNQTYYNFTYALDLHKEFNESTSTVSITAPVLSRSMVVGVVGMHVTYRTFYSLFQDVLKMKSPRQCAGPECFDCYKDPNSTIPCYTYLVDNHGYIVASPSPDENVNTFFGDVENAIMDDMVRREFFVGYNFTDYQAQCNIRAFEKRKSAGAANLLNPIKALVHIMLWTITEVVLFISEFSLTSTWNNIIAAPMGDVMDGVPSCVEFDEIVELYDYDTFKPTEKEAYRQLACAPVANSKKIVGHRPCHKTFTLYKANFQRLKSTLDSFEYRASMRRAWSVPGCYYDEVECEHIDTTEWQDCAPVLRDKNLCHTCDDYTDVDFGLQHKELNYTETEQCEQRQVRDNLDNVPECCDYTQNDDSKKQDNEDDYECGSGTKCVSSLLIFLSLFISKCVL